MYNLKVAYMTADSPDLPTSSTPSSATSLATPASPQAVAIAEPSPVFSIPADTALTTFGVRSTTSVSTADPLISAVPGTSYSVLHSSF